MAILLGGPDRLNGVLAAFYALGVKRGGWVVHRADPGRADRDRDLLIAAGFDVDLSISTGQFQIFEFDPRESAADAATRLHAQLLLQPAFKGPLTPLWYARHLVRSANGSSPTQACDDAWDRAFAGRPLVTLAPYITENARQTAERQFAADGVRRPEARAPHISSG